MIGIQAKIEELLLGSGADLFREFESRFANFCPFEAIGMVRQEIRHAHFLSFILDPNRPHPFQDRLLKSFLLEAVSQAQDGQIDLRPLDVHCSDCSGAIIYRERSNIDILIEIPASAFAHQSKGLVVAVELKVEASESTHQLSTYHDYIRSTYGSDQWSHAFVFLTLDATAPSDENLESWIPVGTADVLGRMESEIQTKRYTGEAVVLFKHYAAMLRRHLVGDEELAQLAKSIWAKHREALEALYEYRPDLQAEILAWVKDNPSELIEAVEKATGFKIEPETSGTRVLRFKVSDWLSLPSFTGGDQAWVSSGSLMVIELTDWGSGRLRLSLVMGPGDPDIRENIYQAVLAKVDAREIKIGRRTKGIGKWKHFSATDAQTAKSYANALNAETTAEEMGRKVVANVVTFLKKHLPVYDAVLKDTLAK